ncbi:MAG: PepSY domain-containing protein [Acidobacteria bacterium]|nr:PepSY domain-containing protein [Acidobacteriota bacterium]
MGSLSRSALLALHQWLGLASAAFLIVIGVSGSALVFENDIDRALNPALSYVTPGRTRQSFEFLLARVRATYPGDRVVGIRVGDTQDQADEFSLRSRASAMVDPYTGAVLGVRDREASVARWLHLLHTRFVAGEFGERLVGWFDVAMLALALTGVVLWWPRRIVSLHRSSSWKRTMFNLHNVVGFYSSIVLVVITATGVLIAFERTTDPLVRTLNGAPEPPPPHSTPNPDATPYTLDEVFAIAAQTLPGAFASNVNVPAGPTGAYRVLMKFPEDRTPAGRSRVYIDQFSGKVLLVENMRTAPLGTRILNLKRSLHTGDIFGAPTRALYFLVSLGIAVQAITGASIWWNARGRLRTRRPSPRSRT